MSQFRRGYGSEVASRPIAPTPRTDGRISIEIALFSYQGPAFSHVGLAPEVRQASQRLAETTRDNSHIVLCDFSYSRIARLALYVPGC